MRRYLPEGPAPGAPATGPALLARSRKGTGPNKKLDNRRGSGRSVYVESEVVEFCLASLPPDMRRAVSMMEEVDRLALGMPVTGIEAGAQRMLLSELQKVGDES